MIYLKLSCYNRIWILPNEKQAISTWQRNWTMTTARQCFLLLSLRFKFMSYGWIMHFLFGHSVHCSLDNFSKQGLISALIDLPCAISDVKLERETTEWRMKYCLSSNCPSNIPHIRCTIGCSLYTIAQVTSFSVVTPVLWVQVKFPTHIDTKTHYIKRNCLKQLLMVGRLLQNSTLYICMQQSILIKLQYRIFSFNGYIHSTSTQDTFCIQRLYSFNFNTGYFCSRQIVIQLQRPKLCLWNKHIYLTSTKKKKHFHSSKHIYSTLQVPGHR